MATQVSLDPMNEETFSRYLEYAVAEYAKDNVKSGRWPKAEADERSRLDFDASLPQGLQTPNNHLFEIVADHEGTSVGVLWFAVAEKQGVKSAFVYDIEIGSEHRRKGFAEAALWAFESLAKERGLSNIELHVFHHNLGAQALYRKLGFRVTGHNMCKDVD